MPNTSVRHREESRRLYVKVLAETSYILIPTATYRQILYFVIPRPRSSCSLLLISWIASARVPLPFFPLLSPRNGDFRTHVSRVSSSLASDPPIFCRTNVLPVGEREEPLSLLGRRSKVFPRPLLPSLQFQVISIFLSFSFSFR